MSNAFSRRSLTAAWLATLAIVIALSTAAGAGLLITALLLVVGIAPVVVIARLWSNVPPPTVAEILHTAETGDGRR